MIHLDEPGIIETFTNYSEYESSVGQIEYQISKKMDSDGVILKDFLDTDIDVKPILGEGSFISLEPEVYSGGAYSEFKKKHDRIQSSIFKKTDNWDGSSPSMVFRDGSAGVGYYEDTMYNSLSPEEMEQVNINKDRIIQRGYDYAPYEVILPDDFDNYPRLTKIRDEQITEDDLLLQKEREFIESKSFEGLSPCVGKWSIWNRNLCGEEGVDNCAVKKRRYTVVSPGDILGQPCPFKDGEEQYDFCWGENDYDRCGVNLRNMCDCDPNNEGDNVEGVACDLKTNNNYCNCDKEGEENYHYTKDHKCSLKNCNCPQGINDEDICYVHNYPSCSSCPDSEMVEQIDDKLFLCNEKTNIDINAYQDTESFIDCDKLSYKNYERFGDSQLLRSSCNDKDYCEIKELHPPTNICKPITDMRCQCKYGVGKDISNFEQGGFENTCAGIVPDSPTILPLDSVTPGSSLDLINVIGYSLNDCSQCAKGHERVASFFGPNSDYNKKQLLRKYYSVALLEDTINGNFNDLNRDNWYSVVSIVNGVDGVNNLSTSVMNEPIYEMSCIQKKCDYITQEELSGPKLQNIIAPSEIVEPINFFNYHESFKCKEGTRFLPFSDYKTSENIHDTSLRLINCKSNTDHYLSEPNIFISGQDLDETIEFNGTCEETSCAISLSDSVLTNNYTLYDLMDENISCNSDSNNCGLGNDLQCTPSCGCKQCNNTNSSEYDLLEIQRNNMGINMDDVEMMEQAREVLNICETPFLKCDPPPFISRLEQAEMNSLKYHGCNLGTEQIEPSSDDCIPPENADEYIVNPFGRYSYSQWSPNLVSCASGYYNNPGDIVSIYKCSGPGEEYILEGCNPSECVLPDPLPGGYNILEIPGNTYNYKINEWDPPQPPNLSCNPGYYSEDEQIVSIESCSYNGGEVEFQGCNECSGPELGQGYYLDSNNNYQCEPNHFDGQEPVLTHCTSNEDSSTLSGCELRVCSYPNPINGNWSYADGYSMMAGYSTDTLIEENPSSLEFFNEPSYIQCAEEGEVPALTYCDNTGGSIEVQCS